MEAFDTLTLLAHYESGSRYDMRLCETAFEGRKITTQMKNESGCRQGVSCPVLRALSSAHTGTKLLSALPSR